MKSHRIWEVIWPACRPCLKNYAAAPLNNEFCHENACRILSAAVARAFAPFNLAATPAFTLSHRHYVKVLFRVEEGAEKAVEAMKGIGFVSYCPSCQWRDGKRLPLMKDCPHCGALIPWYLNIPVASWLCLRGKCASCKGPISFRYTLVELLTALLFLAVFMKWAAPQAMHMLPIPHPLIVPIYWIFIAGLILGTFVDFEHFIIPDSVTIGGMADTGQ